MALVIALASCAGPGPGPYTGAPPGLVRRGENRNEIAYAERAAAEKRKLFRKINADRAGFGVPPVAYDLLAAKVGDDFCLDAATGRFFGHWDLEGRPPYLRWALAGGVDYHGQNAGSVSRKGWDVTASEVAVLLLESHARMMAETPPNDGHRRAILDPNWTHVGIGVAFMGGEFRMTEEFVRRVAEWVELPAGPLPSGAEAILRAQLPGDWSLGALEIAFEPPPVPLSVEEVTRRSTYALPRGFRTLHPVLPPNVRYTDGSAGEFPVSGGRMEARFKLSRGPGSYWAVLFAGKGPSAAGRPLTPVLAARVEAK